MIEIEIDGVGTVEVDDSFKDLTKRQQQEFVNKIARERQSVESKNKRKDGEDGYFANLARTGIGQGLLLGFGDEIEAGLRTGFGLLGDYDKTVGTVRENVRDFAEENPLTALAAEIGGGLVTGGVGGARAAGTAIGRKVLEKAGTAGLAGAVGATEGAIAGAGAGEGALRASSRCRYWCGSWRCGWCGRSSSIRCGGSWHQSYQVWCVKQGGRKCGRP